MKKHVASENSYHILGRWEQKSGYTREKLFRNFTQSLDSTIPEIKVSDKVFASWLKSENISSRNNNEIVVGERVFKLVRMFYKIHQKEVEEGGTPVMTLDELDRLMNIYAHISILYKARLNKVRDGLMSLTNGSSNHESMSYQKVGWEKLFSQFSGFFFIYDSFWTIKATSKYCMELVGLNKANLHEWSFWHRMTTKIGDKDKLQKDSAMMNLRGRHAEQYYNIQMLKFQNSIRQQETINKARYDVLLERLMKAPSFRDRWGWVEKNRIQPHTQVLVPFYRPDDTYIELLEMSMPMSEMEGLYLGAWMPTNSLSFEYLARLHQDVETSTKYHENEDVFFLWDYRDSFNEVERKMLGIIE